MRSIASTPSLARRAGLHHARELVPLVVTVLLIAALLGGAGVTRASIRGAAASSVAAHFGGAGHVAQPTVRDAAEWGADRQDWHAVSDRSVSLVANGRAVTAEARVHDDASLELGHLVEGERPVKPGQMLVTRSVAEGLGLELGDPVEFTTPGDDTRSVTVVGVVQDPAAREAQQVYLLVDEVAPEIISAFVIEWDPFADSTSIPWFEQNQFTYARVASLQERAADEATSTRFAYGTASITGLGLSLLIVTLMGISSLIRTLGPTLASLKSAGLTRSRRRAFVLLLSGVPLVGAVLTGMVLATGFLWVGRSRWSRVFAQDWLTVSWPGAELLFSVVAVVAISSAMAWGVGHVNRRDVRARLMVLPPDAWVTAATTIGVGLAATAVLVALAVQRWVPPELPLVVGFLTTVAAPWALGGLLRRWQMGPAVRAATRPGAVVALVVALTSAMVLTAMVTFTARVVHDARTMASRESATLPPGSLAVDAIPAAQADLIGEFYVSLGGRPPSAYSLPLESSHDFRVADPATARCALEHRLADPFEAMEVCGTDPMVGYVVLGEGELDTAVWAAPEMEENGTAHVVTFARDGGSASTIRVVHGVQRDDALVQPLAGLVIGGGSPLIAELGITPSELRQLVFTDFGALSVPEKAAVRGMILRQAPGAELVEVEAAGATQRTPLLVVVGLAAAALVALLHWAGGRMVIAAFRETRTALRLFHAPRRLIAGVVVSVVGLWLITVVTSVVGGLALAWLITVKDGLGSGWLWAIAPAIVGLFLVGLGASWRRSDLNQRRRRRRR